LRPPQRPSGLDAAPDLERRAGGDPVGGLAFLARELVDALVADHLAPVGGVEQERRVSEGEMDRLGHSTTVAAVRYQHVMADRDAAIAREPNRLIEGG